MNDHEQSQHRAQRDDYAQELTELLQLLEEVDRRITPEHVAKRFRDLLDEIGDDGHPVPPVPADPVVALCDLKQAGHPVLINTSAEWGALISADWREQFDRSFKVTIEPSRKGATPEGACAALAGASSSRETKLFLHAAMSAAAKAAARRCVEDARRGAEQMQDAALEKAARIEAAAREKAARTEADARQKAERLLDEARQAAARIKAAARAEAEEIRAAANGGAGSRLHHLLPMPWPNIADLDSATTAIPGSRTPEGCPSEVTHPWRLVRRRVSQSPTPSLTSPCNMWVSWRNEMPDFNCRLAASTPLERNSTGAELASYFYTNRQTLRSREKEIQQVYVTLYARADPGMLAGQFADFIVTTENGQEVLVQAKRRVLRSVAPNAASPSAPIMALRLLVPSECITYANGLVFASPRRLDVAPWQQVLASTCRVPLPDNSDLAALGSWSSSQEWTRPFVSAWRAIRRPSLCRCGASHGDASARSGPGAQDWPGEYDGDQPFVGCVRCYVGSNALRRVAPPLVASGVNALNVGQAHLVLPFPDYVPDVSGDLYEPIGQRRDDPDLLDGNAEHCGCQSVPG